MIDKTKYRVNISNDALEESNDGESEENLREDPSDEKQYFPQVISGPESALKKRNIVYVKIRPNKGGKKVSDLAKEILKKLIILSDEKLKPWVKLTSLNDLIRTIPPGNADLIKN